MSKEININDNETTDEEDVTKELQDTRTDISKAENRLRSFQTFALQLIIIIIIIWMLFYKSSFLALCGAVTWSQESTQAI